MPFYTPSRQQRVSDAVSLNPPQHLVLTLLSILAVLIGRYQYVIVAELAFLLITKEVEHLFMCLLAVYHPLQSVCFHAFCPCSDWILLLWRRESSVCILDTSLLIYGL